jgi:two-component system chemotaxis response regulator CheY
MNILIVDDSSSVRLLIQNTLAEHPEAGTFKFFNAENGQVALDILEYNTIDIVFVDWHMPVMDGEALTQIIHQDKRFNKVKIIMESAESDKQKVIKMLKQGINGYLLKPFEKGTITKTFDSVRKKAH